jgi:hypothetical protein
MNGLEPDSMGNLHYANDFAILNFRGNSDHDNRRERFLALLGNFLDLIELASKKHS